MKSGVEWTSPDRRINRVEISFDKTTGLSILAKSNGSQVRLQLIGSQLKQILGIAKEALKNNG